MISYINIILLLSCYISGITAAPTEFKLGELPEGMKRVASSFGPWSWIGYVVEDGYEVTSIKDENDKQLWQAGEDVTLAIFVDGEDPFGLRVYTYNGRHEISRCYFKENGVWAYKRCFEHFDSIQDLVRQNVKKNLQQLATKLDPNQFKYFTLDLQRLDEDEHLQLAAELNKPGYNFKLLDLADNNLFEEVKYGEKSLWRAENKNLLPFGLRFAKNHESMFLGIFFFSLDGTERTEVGFKFENGEWTNVEWHEYDTLTMHQCNNPECGDFKSYYVAMLTDRPVFPSGHSLLSSLNVLLCASFTLLLLI